MTIGEVAAPIVIGSDSLVIARVPEGASAGELVIESGKHASAVLVVRYRRTAGR